ncbi:MAG TPA: tetratricopeptide repeat protein, partial [Thermoanaerobaculia bacterium]|nr:tetratricopeptide repeat protein [Thermoanaerobaculia bacterium]
YLVRGIVDETIAALAQVDPPHLSVVGRTPSAAASREGSAAEVGRALDADYLLEGSVRADAGRLRMTVQLIRVRDLATRWVASFDRERGGLLGLERELARAVAEQVRLRLTPARDEAVARRQTRNPAAYDLYLRGRHAVAQRTPPTVLEGIRSFEAAIAADPDYALAWAEIADAYSGLPINSDFPPLEAWQRSREAAARAVAIRPDLAETQVSLGRIGFFDRDWATAESALRRALEIDPDQAEAHLMLGHLLSQTGRQTEALAESAKARSLDPLAPILHALSAQIAFQARDFEGALGHARQALILAPGFWIGLMQEGQTLEQLGEPQPALEALEHAIRLSGANSKPVSLSGYVLARSGRTEAARAVLARLEETSRTRFVPPYALALVHAGLGETSAALDWLERAERVRDVHLVFLPVDPKWDPLRDDPRFVALLERCGLAGEPAALD